jgi:hypothetical protein
LLELGHTVVHVSKRVGTFTEKFLQLSK